MIDAILGWIVDFVVLAFTRHKKKGEEWRGVLEDKRIIGNRPMSRRKHVLYFRTETGKKRKVRVDEEDFALYEKGKNYRKSRGDMLPDPRSAI